MLLPTTQSSPDITHTIVEPSTPLPSIDHEMLSHAVDLNVLYGLDEEKIAGESDLVVELIDLYVADASSKLAEIKQALAGAEEALLNRAAHNLMGSSATLGAHRMALLCDELQRLGSAGSRQSSKALMSKLEDEFSRVRLVFAAERERRLS